MRTLIFILLSPLFASAQVHDNGSIAISGSYLQINSLKQYLFNANHTNTIYRKNIEFSDFETYTNLNRNGSVISSDFSIRLQPRLVHEEWYLFSYGQFSRLYSRKIDFRSEIATGAGVYIFPRLSLSYALIYASTRYFNDSIENGSRHSFRIAYNNTIFKKYGINAEAYYQPSFKDFSNLNYSYIVKFINPVTKNINLTTSAQATYESLCVQGVKGLNSNWSFGITYNY